MKKFILAFIITYCLVFIGIELVQISNKSKKVIEQSTTTTTESTTTTTTTTQKTTKKKVVKKVIKKVATASYEEYVVYAKQIGGYDDKQTTCLIKLWNAESGWNPNARNKKNGACGIPQALPCSKIKKQQGSNDWKAQIRWGVKYIKDRYSTPCNAWEKFLSRKPHWY